jgi:DNA-binding transcriptional LysR family regulator
MNFSDLQIFKAVVDEGGITKAATKLRRVPSGVTTRIKHLESSMGVTLFHRDRHRMHLSPTGELLLGYADRIIRLSEEARLAVSGSSPRGVLRLGSLESTAASRLPRLLSDFHALYPEVRLELTTGTNDFLVDAVAERRLDAAFTAEAPGGSLQHAPVFSERLVLISRLDHPPIKHPRDVKDVSVIAFPNGCAYRRVLERWFGRSGLSGARVLELSSYHAIVACVVSGTGIALMPESVLEAMPHTRVRRHSLSKTAATIVTPLVWRRDEISPPVFALRTLVASFIKGKKVA